MAILQTLAVLVIVAILSAVTPSESTYNPEPLTRFDKCLVLYGDTPSEPVCNKYALK